MACKLFEVVLLGEGIHLRYFLQKEKVRRNELLNHHYLLELVLQQKRLLVQVEYLVRCLQLSANLN